VYIIVVTYFVGSIDTGRRNVHRCFQTGPKIRCSMLSFEIGSGKELTRMVGARVGCHLPAIPTLSLPLHSL